MNMGTSYLLDSLKPEEFAIFCGAGISKNSGLPLANKLKQYILEKLPIDKKDIKEIMNSILPFEAFIETLSENTDISRILDIFEDGEPNTNHILIARLAKSGYLKTISTTNFDLLIERALENEGLKRGIDFQVYSDEEQFSGIDFENIENGKIRIFKIHGSVDNKDSVRTTMRAVASRTLSDKRMNVIRYLFSTGKHKRVLVLGYSCSDEFDITPQIQSIEENRKEIIFVGHSEREEIEEIKTKDLKNPFKKSPGIGIKCNTDKFIERLWTSLKGIIGEEYNFRKSEAKLGKYVDEWAKALEENKRHHKYFIAGFIFYNISAFNRAIEYFRNSLEITKEIGDRAGEAACYGNLGNAYGALGDFRRAIEYHEKDLVIAKAIGDKGEEARRYANLGAAYYGLGGFKRAIEYYEKDLVIAKAIGDKAGEATCYGNLGNAYGALGGFKRAIEYYEKDLVIAKAIGDKAGEATCYANLGNAYGDLGDFRRAIEYHEKALEIAKAIGYKEIEATCYVNLGSAYGDLGDFRRAIEYYLKAEKVFKEIGQIHFLGKVYRNLALVYEKIGDNKKAEDYKRKLSSDTKIL